MKLLYLLPTLVLFAALPNREAGLRPVQYGFREQLAVGKVLVADEKLADPNFAQSVVLILQYDSDNGTLGLIVNRRADTPLSKLFPDLKGAKTDPVYLGGPVDLGTAQALLRLPAPVDLASHVFGDVYATGNKDLIEKSVASGVASSRFRVYAGYAGWAPGQIEAEIDIGAWSVREISPALVFDGDPDSLWSRLTRASHSQIAGNTRTQ